MAVIHRPPGWKIRESQVTSEKDYWNRRNFIKKFGLGGISVFGGLSLGYKPFHEFPQDSKLSDKEGLIKLDKTATSNLYPAQRSNKYTVTDSLTDELIAARYNNFYEFTTQKDGVWKLVDKFKTRPWQVKIHGLVENPGVFDIDDLVKSFPLEERIYRFRCVERWAMIVPWTGIPFNALIKKVQPKSNARYIRFITLNNPDVFPGQKNANWYSWPYYEGLTIEEAQNELTLLATGIYGHRLPKQHGAPVRLVVPWKYGYKSIKSIVEIEFVAKQPPTFWNDLAPHEYPFISNINPDVPHPRWSQAYETIIGTGERRKTEIYNGYEQYVAQLY